MLILTRRTGETLCVGDDIKATVISVQGNQARLGVSAPNDANEVSVHREEVYQKTKDKNDKKYGGT